MIVSTLVESGPHAGQAFSRLPRPGCYNPRMSSPVLPEVVSSRWRRCWPRRRLWRPSQNAARWFVAGIWVLAAVLVGGPVRMTPGAEIAADQSESWIELAAGLELGRFPLGASTVDSVVTVVRIDPARWELKLLSSDQVEAAKSRSVRHWCHDFGLVAAVNAGMYATDRRTHVGYLRLGNYVNSAHVNQYLSVAAFGPLRDGLPPFRIFDLDSTDLKTINPDYECVVQNLRLIKRPQENRWSQQDRRWSEVALGEDDRGRVLFIFCRTPFSMHDLNARLVALPLQLMCAQHLEGGPLAQLYLHHGQTEVDLVGGYESGFQENDLNVLAWPVPIVIGIVPRRP